MSDKTDFVLLAGGYAGSLRPITEYMPKAMLPLGSKPIIRHIIDNIIKNIKIQNIYIIANYYSEIIFEYISLLKQAKIINHETFFIKSDPEEYSNGGVLLNVKDTVNDNFLLYYSDVIPLSMNYSSFINSHIERKQEQNYLGTLATSNYYNLETGYLKINKIGNITNFTEKPNKDEKIKNMAIGLFNSKIIDHIDDKKSNFFKDIIPSAIRKGYIFYTYNHDSYWHHLQHINKYHYEQVLNYDKWIKLNQHFPKANINISRINKFKR